jgi:serine/threonine protein kinase
MVDRVGQQLGNYRLIRLLGRGGFAEVYLGEHVYLKTPGAIKLLQTNVSTPADLEGFLTEAQTIAQLVHPHIVRVMDFGVDGATPFLVMDYAMGGTLRQRHPKGTQLPLSTILPYVKHVAEALQYAHEEKFIHRDVKPENMLVGRRDAVLLSDFGIALIAQSSRYQSTQEVIGTVAYMSPEQIQGRPRPASDQYSLGIVVYEWLSGDRPFRGSFTELCTQHMFAPPPPLREKLPTLSPAVEQVVMTALSKDPHQRFATIQAFATALEQASQVETSPALPASRSWPAIEAMPQPRPAQPPMELATAPSESVIPTEVVAPPRQTSISPGQSTPLSQTPIPPELSAPSSQTAVPAEANSFYLSGESRSAQHQSRGIKSSVLAFVGEGLCR